MWQLYDEEVIVVLIIILVMLNLIEPKLVRQMHPYYKITQHLAGGETRLHMPLIILTILTCNAHHLIEINL